MNPKSVQGIQSLEIGLRLFQNIHRLGRPASLSEIAASAAMHPSKAHRYLASLIRVGFVEQDGRGRYAVGPYAFQLAHHPSNDAQAIEVAASSVERLAESIDQTAFLAAWGRNGPKVLRVAESNRPISVRPATDDELPVLDSATARVFAAFMEPAALERILERTAPGRQRKAFLAQLETVRKHGLSRNLGERYPGINSISAPVFNVTGRVIYAVTLVGLDATLSPDWGGPAAKAVARCAAEITRRLGGRPPDNGGTAGDRK